MIPSVFLYQQHFHPQSPNVTHNLLDFCLYKYKYVKFRTIFYFKIKLILYFTHSTLAYFAILLTIHYALTSNKTSFLNCYVLFYLMNML